MKTKALYHSDLKVGITVKYNDGVTTPVFVNIVSGSKCTDNKVILSNGVKFESKYTQLYLSK